MNNTLYLPVSVEDESQKPIEDVGYFVYIGDESLKDLAYLDEDGLFPKGVTHWLKPLSLEEVRDYLAGVQGNDLASLASHSCTDGNSIEQEAIEFFEYAKESDLYWDWKWAKERLNLKENE
jgi:hypothetical protein